MCVLFVYLNDGTDDQVGYKMVLISNRDEYWMRPTETADFRGENKLWIGGVDLTRGHEGGTWLGMNRQGQVAVLLNILAVEEIGKRGRGYLVTDFVTNTKISCEEYLDSVSSEQSDYKPFQLVLIDLGESTPCFHYLNNAQTTIEHSRKVIKQKTFAADNSVNSCHNPWRKTQNGQTKFIDILQKYGDLQSKDELIEKCIELLSDKTQYFLDPKLQQFISVGRADEELIIAETKALNVFSPSGRFGTRTNTMILVDKDNNCDYIERTLETPVNVEQPRWSTVKHRFKLESDHHIDHCEI